MKKVDDVLYEARPFLLFAIAATSANFAPKTTLAHTSLALLTLSAMMICFWRYQYRAHAVHPRKRS